MSDDVAQKSKMKTIAQSKLKLAFKEDIFRQHNPLWKASFGRNLETKGDRCEKINERPASGNKWVEEEVPLES